MKVEKKIHELEIELSNLCERAGLPVLQFSGSKITRLIDELINLRVEEANEKHIHSTHQ